VRSNKTESFGSVFPSLEQLNKKASLSDFLTQSHKAAKKKLRRDELFEDQRSTVARGGVQKQRHQNFMALRLCVFA
jgi:hypothetical protein